MTIRITLFYEVDDEDNVDYAHRNWSLMMMPNKFASKFGACCEVDDNDDDDDYNNG